MKKRKRKGLLKTIFLGLLAIGLAGAVLNLFKEDKKEKDDTAPNGDDVVEKPKEMVKFSCYYRSYLAETFEVEKGTTWAEFIYERYEGDNFSVNGDTKTIMYCAIGRLQTLDGTVVSSDDEILPGYYGECKEINIESNVGESYSFHIIDGMKWSEFISYCDANNLHLYLDNTSPRFSMSDECVSYCSIYLKENSDGSGVPVHPESCITKDTYYMFVE